MEAATATRTRPEVVMRGYREGPSGWLGWLSTTDHKRIGIMYMGAALIFFVVGGAEALLMRLQLAQAESTLIDAQTYNGLVTMHGTTMVFLVGMPILAGFANYLVPLQIGARDLAFPRLNALAFWITCFGGLLRFDLSHPITPDDGGKVRFDVVVQAVR